MAGGAGGNGIVMGSLPVEMNDMKIRDGKVILPCWLAFRTWIVLLSGFLGFDLFSNYLFLGH